MFACTQREEQRNDNRFKGDKTKVNERGSISQAVSSVLRNIKVIEKRSVGSYPSGEILVPVKQGFVFRFNPWTLVC